MLEEDILINEYKELTIFRERQIHSIESSVNTYLTFLGFLLTALTILLSQESIAEIDEYFFYISISVGTVFFLYGLRTFRLLYISHENLVIYTRQLNITRKKLVGKMRKWKKEVFLPTRWQHVKFDRFGHEKVNFSKTGTSGTVKGINSLVISIVLIGALFRFCNEKLSVYWYILFFLSVLFASRFFHNRWITCAIKSSKERWNEMMGATKKSDKYFDNPNSD